MKLKNYLVHIILLCIAGSIHAQRTKIFTSSEAEYKSGIELFEKEKYGAAQHHFEYLIKNYGEAGNNLITNAQYYAALCAIELFNDDAEFLILEFIDEHQESAKVNDAYYEMGKFQYRQKEYTKAVFWLEKVRKDDLVTETLPEYYFKKGYSYFNIDSLDKAEMAFYEVKDKSSKYASPATYYSAHIEYTRKNYETALQKFESLSKDETFSSIVPYYIAQIYYLQKRYDDVIAYAPSILESATAKREPEIARVIGESYYHKRLYKEAVQYLERYHAKAKNVSREDNYQLAYTYYKIADYSKADSLFEEVTILEDSLGQNAFYHLADCYVHLENKNKARQAFLQAAHLDFDPVITEEALYNYALVTYELNFSPFNEAINAFKEFINKYPDSEHTDDAYNFLVTAYMYTKNYKEALSSLEKIKAKDDRIKEAYQKVTFFRALELYNNLGYEEAIEHLDKSLQYAQYNKTIKARAHYWKAEALYRQYEYQKAIENYNEFLLTSGAFLLDEYNLTHYNIGYCYFKLHDYANAILWFEKYVYFEKDNKTAFVGDAYNRTGDGYFLLRTYWLAIEFYDKAIEAKATDADYSLFQRGFVLGLVKRPEKKIESLERLISQFPKSSYIDDALHEMGVSYMELQHNTKAEKSFRAITENFQGSSYEKKALLNIGLIKYNESKYDESITLYKQLIAQYPGTPEARNALTGMKNIYIDQNNVDAYFSYLKSIGGGDDMSVFEMDSLTYMAAEKVYMSGNYKDSKASLKKYIQDYPNGSFVLSARYYMAQCNMADQEFDEALESYNYIIDKPKNTFTEQSLLGAADIYFKKGDYRPALTNYLKLNDIAEVKGNLLGARIGIMRSDYFLGDYTNTITAADKLLLTEKIPAEIIRETRYKKAQSLFTLNKLDQALEDYRILSSDVKSKEGAESKYKVAEILFIQNKANLAEKEIFDFIQKNTPYQYWMAKGFILLSDIYMKKEDYFQAKPTLQSIIDNYGNKDDGIIDLAKEKYNIILEKEKEKMQPKKEDDIEIKL